VAPGLVGAQRASQKLVEQNLPLTLLLGVHIAASFLFSEVFEL